MEKANARIGIDLGGTKIEGLVIEGDSKDPSPMLQRRIPTEADKGYNHLLKTVTDFIEQLARECDLDDDAPVGMGMPGSITSKGLIKNSNTVCLNGTPFRKEIADELKRPITFANDANCFALAEALMGAGKGYEMVFGVIMGTGTGGGLVINGKVREGPQSIAGEWGHTILRPDSDRECYCGHKGCVETYLAGPWIEDHFRRLSGESLPLKSVLEMYQKGDSNAGECVRVWLEHYGRAMANLINVLDPDVIVLGGGVSNADCLYGQGLAQVAKYVFTDELTTPIVRHVMGDSAGVFGAALLTESK